MRKHPLRSARNDSDQKLLDDVARVGWHTIGIPADEVGPAHAFSIGLYHSFDQPEILVVGLDIEDAFSLINLIAEQMRGGAFKESDRVEEILEGFPVVFRAVAKSDFKAYLGYAMWFYESSDFPVLQCVWPDRASRFPGDVRCDAGCDEVQRLM